MRKYIDYTGKSIRCISDKYGNFTKGKTYPIYSKFINLAKKPTDFKIDDDENDCIDVESLLKKTTKFILID